MNLDCWCSLHFCYNCEFHLHIHQHLKYIIYNINTIPFCTITSRATSENTIPYRTSIPYRITSFTPCCSIPSHIPNYSTPHLTILHYIYQTIQHTNHAKPYNVISYHTTANHNMPHHTTLYHTTPHHTTLFHTLLYHITPHHTITYHTIPYHHSKITRCYTILHHMLQ